MDPRVDRLTTGLGGNEKHVSILLRNGYNDHGEGETEEESLEQLKERLGDGARRTERMNLMWHNGWDAYRADPSRY